MRTRNQPASYKNFVWRMAKIHKPIVTTIFFVWGVWWQCMAYGVWCMLVWHSIVTRALNIALGLKFRKSLQFLSRLILKSKGLGTMSLPYTIHCHTPYKKMCMAVYGSVWRMANCCMAHVWQCMFVWQQCCHTPYKICHTFLYRWLMCCKPSIFSAFDGLTWMRSHYYPTGCPW